MNTADDSALMLSPSSGAGASLTRRSVLRRMAGLGALAVTGGSGSLFGACMTAQPGSDTLAADQETAALVDSIVGIDIHSRAAGSNGRARATYDLAERIRSGRMTAVCLCYSSDVPVIRREPDSRIRTIRSPESSGASPRVGSSGSTTWSPGRGCGARYAGEIWKWRIGTGRRPSCRLSRDASFWKASWCASARCTGAACGTCRWCTSSGATWETTRPNLPLVVRQMRRRGFSPDQFRKIAGANYLRVFNLSVKTL